MEFLPKINRIEQDFNPNLENTKLFNLDLSTNSYIIIDKKYLGQIKKILWNGDGCIVKLICCDNYKDPLISQYQTIQDGYSDGHMIITKKNIIEIPNPDNLLEIIKFTAFNQNIDGLINLKIANNFNNFISFKLKKDFSTEPKLSTMIPINPIKLINYEKEDMDENYYAEYIIKMIQDIFMENNNVLFYEENTALSNTSVKSIDILSEDNVNNTIKPTICSLLLQYKSIDMEYYYDFKKSLIYRNTILNKDDTLNFGTQIINQIKNNLLKAQFNIQIKDQEHLIQEVNLFDFIEFKIIDGYIEMVNKFLPADFRTVSKENCPGNELFSDMYGKPIDYKTLTNFILANNTLNDIEKNQDDIAEAIRIMSIEYLICIQPKVEFLLWIINRLIFCWYADPILYANIYKIKILINLYRGRGIKEFNRDADVLPIIIIVPKYGKTISRKVMSLISYYFFPYKRLALKNSNPTYFNKLDNMMYYTNGSLEVKKYIKFILGKNNIFNKNLTQVIPDKIIEMIPNDIQF